MHVDCLVIGLGGMGSSVLYELAARGLHVAGIEQYERGHQRGSSHGEFRVFRKAYFEHPDYVPLLQAAERGWRDLEVACGEELYCRIGVLLAGPPQGDAIAGTLAAATRYSLPVERLTAAEAQERWPGLQFDQGEDVVLDADAGILAVERCVRACLRLAERQGATTHFGERLCEWAVEDAGVRVRTERRTWTADRIVFAGGAWAQSLLPDVLPPLRILRKVQSWHSWRSGCERAATDLPAFFFETPGGAFYGMPTGTASVKLARHTGGPEFQDPLHAEQEDAMEEQTAIADFARQRIRDLDPAPARISRCLYTVSPDGHFIVDRHPTLPGVSLAAGFSGHGFKFASVMGRVLADLVVDDGTALPIDFLSAARFQ